MKKSQYVRKSKLNQVFTIACKRRVLAKISSTTFEFTANFVEINKHYLLFENTLKHLEDLRLLSNKKLTLYFPFRDTLLKGAVQFLGLTTHQNIRVIQFSRPDRLSIDEKREGKRVFNLPGNASIVFNTYDFQLFQGQICNISSSGMAFYLQDDVEAFSDLFEVGSHIQAEASLFENFKISFDAEIRFVSVLDKALGKGALQLGVKILNLQWETQERLNEWLYRISTYNPDPGRKRLLHSEKDELVTSVEPVANTIVVLGPTPAKSEVWRECMGRKYEVIVSDMNMSNIRHALATHTELLLVYLNPKDTVKASFTRRFCLSLKNRYPIIFFSEVSDPKKQHTLMGQVNNRGFIDTSKRKILNWFLIIDKVINELHPSLET